MKLEDKEVKPPEAKPDEEQQEENPDHIITAL
jgi:hypothetical protein